MRPLFPVLVLVMALATAIFLVCRPEVEQPDHQAEWRAVLEQKKQAVTKEASTREKQVYADAVSAFVRKHPQHGRAREVYHTIQIEFADDLAAIGRYRQAVRFYRAVLARDARNARARRGLAVALDHLAVTREKLLRLEKGMSHRQVAGVLGKPVPGWTVKHRRREATLEAWYYRTTRGGIAGVYFRNGRVFAAEENADARTSRLGT